MKRLLNYDADTGMVEWFHGHGDGSFSIETYQEAAVVKAILERNKREANDHDKMKRGIKRGFMRAACIPVGVQHKWLKEEGFDVYEGSQGYRPHQLSEDGQKKFKRLLNSPDYKYLRTIDGKL
jgi:succinate dehydrogenase flavin-adding protein (antitoxin of CptAB toxin-antitoxin module)